MAIIALSREIAAFGDEVAAELAKLLGYDFVDKAIIETKLNEYGITPEKRDRFDEKKPGFWASLSQSRDDYLHFLRTVILKEASEGNKVFIGRGAFAILKDVPGALFVRLVSPYEIRVQRIKAFYSCDDRRASQIIAQSDHDRAGFHKYFFNASWESPEYFQIVVNTGLVPPPTAAAMIKQLLVLTVTPDVEEAGRKKVAELCLSQEVATEIAYKRKIPVHFLEVEAKGKVVTLHGVANTQGAIEAAVSTARGVPGVSDVVPEIQVVQEYTVMP
jgi:hypothetical protein